MVPLILAVLIIGSAHSALAQPDDWYRDRHDGVHLRILRDYELKAGETAYDPVVIIGGSATIDGRVENDVVVIGGSLRVGPTAVISGDVAAIGGQARIDPAAQIRGNIDETIMAGPDFDVDFGWLTGGWWPAFALGAMITRLGVVLVVALLLTIVTPDWVRGMARRVSGSPLGSAAIGLAGQILFVPALVALTIALVISVVGILLFVAYPFLFGALAVMWVAGYAAVAMTLGARLLGRDAVTSRAPIVDLLAGFLLISALTLLAQAWAVAGGYFGAGPWAVRAAGWIVEWLAWTVALGAALASAFGSRHPVTPPRLPYAAPAPTPS